MAAPDWWLINTYDCRIHNYRGAIRAKLALDGHSMYHYIVPDSLIVTVDVSGSPVISGFYNAAADPITVAISLTAEAFSENLRSNWVGWSKIGDIRFLQDMMNDSGYRPMSWKGWVYQILQLGKSAVVYGSGGISILFPIKEPHPTFGYKEIAKRGILNRNCVCGTKNKHFFLD